MERIIPSLVPHKEPMLALLPLLSNPCPSGYHSLADTLDPIDNVLVRDVTLDNPVQTFNPTVSNPTSVSSHPISSISGGESSAQMVSVHSKARGKPLA